MPSNVDLLQIGRMLSRIRSQRFSARQLLKEAFLRNNLGEKELKARGIRAIVVALIEAFKTSELAYEIKSLIESQKQELFRYDDILRSYDHDAAKQVEYLYLKYYSTTERQLNEFLSRSFGDKNPIDQSVGLQSSSNPQLEYLQHQIMEFARQHPGASISEKLRALADEIDALNSNELPTKAPALWEKDRSSDDTPETFIARHYSQYIGKGLTTKALDDLDHSLNMAYGQWSKQSETEMLPELSVPTKHDGSQSIKLSPPDQEPDLPTVAPSLWKDRADNGSPADFIMKNYRTWIGKGLTKGHIKQLDPTLYIALYRWEKKPRRDIPLGFDLPSRQEPSQLEDDNLTDEQIKHAQRIISRRHRQRQKDAGR